MNYKILFILLIYFIFQCLTLNYGTKINDIEHIFAYKTELGDLKGSHLESNSIVSKINVSKTKITRNEELSKAINRYKLFGIEADEPVVLMGLSRIDPGNYQFDPHFYQYGGAFLYPVGGFLFLGMKTGLLKLDLLPLSNWKISLNSLLNNPNNVDRIYIFGRSFVLICFVLSAWILSIILKQFTTRTENLLLIAIYLFAPASIMFSQIMKPHWYALIWINISLFVLTKLFLEKQLQKRYFFLLCVSLGFSVGSSSILSIYTLFVWFALFYAKKKDYVPSHILITIPFFSIIFFFMSNPYILINYNAFVSESKALGSWFNLDLDFKYLYYFAYNSLFTGFGIVFCLFIFILIIHQIFKPSKFYLRAISISILIVFILTSLITASIYTWHTNFRYMPYLLPILILFTALVPIAQKKIIMLTILFFTIVQTIPLKIAYFDENNPRFSTRQLSAKWINQNISPGSAISTQTGPLSNLAPYSTPPFDFTLYNIVNSEQSDYLVNINRQIDTAGHPQGYLLMKRFRPRLTNSFFPLVFSHINPQVNIYEKLSK